MKKLYARSIIPSVVLSIPNKRNFNYGSFAYNIKHLIIGRKKKQYIKEKKIALH